MIRRWIGGLLAGALCFAHPAFAAEQSANDAYAACLIGNVAVELHNGITAQEASDRALVTCETLEAAVPEDEYEYVIDFVDSVLAQLDVPGSP